jgi:hypothetical protein
VYARNGSWLDRPLHRQRQQLRLWSGITEERRKFEESIGAKAPPSRYRLAKDRLADLMAMTTELGLTKPTSTAFWYSRPPSRAPLKCSTASFLPVREQRRCSGTTACSREMPRQELGDGLGCAAGGPFDGSRRTIAISQGQDRAAVGCTRLSVDTVERALDAYERLRR